jgi:hypothetical protein
MFLSVTLGYALSLCFLMSNIVAHLIENAFGPYFSLLFKGNGVFLCRWVRTYSC